MSPENIRHQVSSAFQVIQGRSNVDELCVLCPVPGCGDKSGNRSINLKNGYTNCWRCPEGQPHHIKSLFTSVGLEFQDDGTISVEEVNNILFRDNRKPLTPVQVVELPLGFQFLSDYQESCYHMFCANMAKRKHLDITDLEKANAGFTREGLWEPFCIFPVIEDDRVVYYQGRTYTDDGFEKTKKFPSKQEVRYGMSYWVYNLNALTSPPARLGIIVESILNVLSLRKYIQQEKLPWVPVCVFTHRISAAQFNKICRYRHIKEWCVLFDSDSTALAHASASRLNPIRPPISVAEMPHGKNDDDSVRTTNDANDDVEAAIEAIKKRKKADSLSNLTGPKPIITDTRYPAYTLPL
jgi:hypothetical protein